MSSDSHTIAPARLERRLQVSVVLLALLGTLLLGMGQMDYRLPTLVLLTGATSLLITDLRRWVQIGGFVANVAALVAVGFSIGDYLVFDTESQLLAIANLLVYLQIILQFQKKTIRIFWQLVMLSLLQVVVACALNLGVMFGVLLVIYLCCALRVLTLLYVLRETNRYADPKQREVPRGQSVSTTTPGTPARERWFGETVSGQFSGPAVNRTMWRSIALTTALTMIVTVLIFSVVPRYHREAWRGFAAPTIRVVGYSDEVTVGDLGPIVQNPEIVMRVQLFDPDTDEPFAAAGHVLFRGAVHSNYIGRGKWRRKPSSRIRRMLGGTVAGTVSSDDRLVRQEFVMQRSEDDVMFSIFPPVSPTDGLADRYVRYDIARNQLFRTNHDSPDNTKTQYVIHTLGIRDGAVAPIVPTLLGDRIDRNERNGVDTRRLDHLGKESSQLPQLIALAQRVDEQSGLEEEDRIGRARALADYLGNSGEFTYTLQPQERDWELDPIEDFIANTRRGHCEYYSSALTLMLRSRGIPARMVIGFAGDEWNEFGSFYQVRQLHAHTWVEVYLPLDQLPDEAYYGSPHFAGGGWLTLDPTPEGTDDGVTLANSDWFSGARQLFDYVQLLWTSHVVDMTPRRQEQAVYAPIRKQWTALEDSINAMFEEDDENAHATSTSIARVNWTGVIIGIVGGAGLLALLIVICRPLRNWLGRVCRRLLRRQPRSAISQQADVPFYQALEKMLAREGIRRQASQTQREFAFDAGAQLADRPALGAVAGLPRQVADAFYRVRFGGHALDNTQAQAVEQALAELGRALAGSRRG